MRSRADGAGSCHWHKSYGENGTLLNFPFMLFEKIKFLHFILKSHGNHHSSALAELFDQRRGNAF